MKKSRAETQRRYRENLRSEGAVRLDIYIPADLWRRLEPHLRQYHQGRYPGKAIVELLKDIRFVDE
ncbi:hypothetical protein [Methylobacter luteus]|uniref:hypothetical protein n=1 Tax=Methylobacter luteus TaxID=415 RepID=UPI0003FEDA56|nr:hypothetical protein [Methylobacter luteus]